MSLPNIRVYIKPDASFIVSGNMILGTSTLSPTTLLGPSTASFYEISDMVTGVSVRRGRTRVTDSFDTGTATVQLIDRTGVLNPDNTSSPLNGWVIPLRQFKITATIDGTEHSLFNGFTSRYTYDYQHGINATFVSIEANDAFRILNLASIETVTGAADNQDTGTRIGQILSTAGVPNSVVSLETGDTFLGDDPATQRTTLEAIQNAESSELGAFYMSADGIYTFKARHTVQQLASAVGITPLLFNERRIARTNICPNPSFESNLTSWATGGGTCTNTRTAGTIAGGNGAWSLVAVATTTGSYGPSISAGTMTFTANPITVSAQVLRLTGTRTYRCLINWWNASSVLIAQSLGTGDACATSTRLSVTGTAPALAVNFSIGIQSVGTGLVGDSHQMDSVLVEQSPTLDTYFDGYVDDAIWNGTVNNSTSTLRSGIEYVEVSQGLDDEQVYNNVTVIDENLNVSNFVDSTSVSAYFTRSLEKSGTLIRTSTEANYHAQFLLAQRKDPALTIDSIEVAPLALSTGDGQSIITAELLEPVTITKKYGSGYLTRTLTIQGVEHDITPSTWTTRLSTAEPVSGDGFILDSATFGVLNQNELSF